MFFRQATVQDCHLGLRRKRLLARQAATDRHAARAMHGAHAAQPGHWPDHSHEHKLCQPINAAMLAFDRNEPHIACREPEVSVNFDVHIFRVFGKRPLDKQMVLIGQQVKAHFKEAILLVPVADDPLLGGKSRELLNMREITGFV